MLDGDTLIYTFASSEYAPMERAHVRVNGVVQSVGFRPFVYRTAVELDLRGRVRNLGDAGVHVTLEGPSDRIEAFVETLRADPPPLAEIETLTVDAEDIDAYTYSAFEIEESTPGRGGSGTVPPDTAICDACLADVQDSDSRFQGYWATACVDCGPRFTVIEGLPYDRETTSMAAFPLCDDCLADYSSPANRRYHAQAIACPACGPALAFQPHDSDRGAPVRGDASGIDPLPEGPQTVAGDTDALAAAGSKLADGGIVVLKGIGGAHLACDATDGAAVASLRDRTGRPEKPLAVMAPSIDCVEGFASVSQAERELLTSARRPIIVLPRSGDDLASQVAPDLHTVGVMLPYSGLHHLLFEHIEGPLVVTSANRPGIPMAASNREILDQLWDVADASLLHNRHIVTRCDDSVARVVGEESIPFRRSRGYVPLPVAVPTPAATTVLAVGPERDVTAGILCDDECYLTQHVGTVDSVETFQFLKDAIDHLCELTGQELPPVVAHDAHPSFRTTEYARTLAEQPGVSYTVPVQHHHAHAASVLMENDRQRAICIAADGVGYGADGTVWGGEVLDATLAEAERVASLAPVPMPGGDRATEYPVRSLVGLLAETEEIDTRPVVESLDWEFPSEDGLTTVRQQIDAEVNTPTTTSAGRFLDAIAALTGICHERTYEGEPAMKLEAAAVDGSPRDVEVPYAEADGRRVLDTPRLTERLVELCRDGASASDVAATAQRTLADGLARLALEAATERDIDAIGFTGGVAYNAAIGRRIGTVVRDAGLTYLRNRAVPPGDGGIAYGQAGVAAATVQNSESSS